MPGPEAEVENNDRAGDRLSMIYTILWIVIFLAIVFVLLLFYPGISEFERDMVILSCLFIGSAGDYFIVHRVSPKYSLKKQVYNDIPHRVAYRLLDYFWLLSVVIIAIPLVLEFFHIPLSSDVAMLGTILGMIIGSVFLLWGIHRAGQKYNWDWSRWD
jgi:hypothetical protein